MFVTLNIIIRMEIDKGLFEKKKIYYATFIRKIFFVAMLTAIYFRKKKKNFSNVFFSLVHVSERTNILV